MHIDTKKLKGTVPSKIVARLAGLGWVGKSCLFINPQYGPRVRLKTILTDAPFQPGKIMENRCDDCRECVDACPADAISNSFSLTRDKHYYASTCMEYGRQRGRSLKWSIGNPCGLCVYICPYGGMEKKPKPKKVAITQAKRITAFSKADTHYRLATA